MSSPFHLSTQKRCVLASFIVLTGVEPSSLHDCVSYSGSPCEVRSLRFKLQRVLRDSRRLRPGKDESPSGDGSRILFCFSLLSGFGVVHLLIRSCRSQGSHRSQGWFVSASLHHCVRCPGSPCCERSHLRMLHPGQRDTRRFRPGKGRTRQTTDSVNSFMIFG